MDSEQLDFWGDTKDVKKAAFHMRKEPVLFGETPDEVIQNTIEDTINALEKSETFIICPGCENTTLVAGEGGGCDNCGYFSEKPKQFLLVSDDGAETIILPEKNEKTKTKRSRYKLDQSTGIYYDEENFSIDIIKKTFFLAFKNHKDDRHKLAISGKFSISSSDFFDGNKISKIPHATISINKKYEWMENEFYLDGKGYTAIRNRRSDFNYKKLSKLLRVKLEGGNIS